MKKIILKSILLILLISILIIPCNAAEISNLNLYENSNKTVLYNAHGLAVTYNHNTQAIFVNKAIFLSEVIDWIYYCELYVENNTDTNIRVKLDTYNHTAKIYLQGTYNNYCGRYIEHVWLNHAEDYTWILEYNIKMFWFKATQIYFD